MANRTTTNPIFIDTWSADVVLPAGIRIAKIITFSATAGDKFALDSKITDTAGAYSTQIHMHTTLTGSRTDVIDFGMFPGSGWKYNDGFVIDVSDCTGYGANDLAWIYLA